jgi:inorganic pyrophosphatase/exopolyphosphatase
MVSSIISDALRDPSKEIQDLKTSQDHSGLAFPAAVEKYFRDLLSPHDAFTQVSHFETRMGV